MGIVHGKEDFWEGVPPGQSYFSALDDLFEKNRYCRLQLSYFHFGLSPEAICLLCYFINIVNMKYHSKNDSEKLLKNKGWFECSFERVHTETRFSDYIQIKVLEELKKKGLICTQVKGFGKMRRRYLLVQIFKVNQMDEEHWREKHKPIFSSYEEA